jgi:ribosomal protein S27E
LGGLEMFLVKCSKCGTLGELEDGFLKKKNDISVYDSGRFTVSIKCNGCGHEIFSSEDD